MWNIWEESENGMLGENENFPVVHFLGYYIITNVWILSISRCTIRQNVCIHNTWNVKIFCSWIHVWIYTIHDIYRKWKLNVIVGYMSGAQLQIWSPPLFIYEDITLDIQHILRQGKGGNVKNEFLIPLEIIFYFGHTNSKVWRMEGFVIYVKYPGHTLKCFKNFRSIFEVTTTYIYTQPFCVYAFTFTFPMPFHYMRM